MKHLIITAICCIFFANAYSFTAKDNKNKSNNTQLELHMDSQNNMVKYTLSIDTKKCSKEVLLLSVPEEHADAHDITLSEDNGKYVITYAFSSVRPMYYKNIYIDGKKMNVDYIGTKTLNWENLELETDDVEKVGSSICDYDFSTFLAEENQMY